MFFPSVGKYRSFKYISSFGLGLVLIMLSSLSMAEGLGIIDAFPPLYPCPISRENSEHALQSLI